MTGCCRGVTCNDAEHCVFSPVQALVSCLELLEDENVDTRVCGCKALACLKVQPRSEFVLLFNAVPPCQNTVSIICATLIWVN